MSTDPPGLRYRKLDLHLHTPASHDFEDKDVTPKQVVQAAIDAGLDGIAVTDHNTGAWVDEVKDAAHGTGLVVFPGVEISCAGGTGGIHVIALFDPKCTRQHVEGLLSTLEIPPEQFGSETVLTHKSPMDVANVISKKGRPLCTCTCQLFEGRA